MKKIFLATILALAIGAAVSAGGANSPTNPRQLASAASAEISNASSAEATSVQDDLREAADLLNAALNDPGGLRQTRLAPVPPSLGARADPARASSQRVRANIAFVTPL